MSTFSLSNTGSEINDAIAKVHNADTAPTNGSTNMVTSGGVHTAINNLDLTNLAGSSLVTESEGIASNDNDDTIPTSAAVKSYVESAAIKTLVATFPVQSMSGSYATVESFNSNFGATQSGGVFSVPNGTYIYMFYGATNAGSTYRVILSLGDNTNSRLANLAYTGWSSAQVGSLKGFNSTVTVSNGELGLYGANYGSDPCNLTESSSLILFKVS